MRAGAVAALALSLLASPVEGKRPPSGKATARKTAAGKTAKAASHGDAAPIGLRLESVDPAAAEAVVFITGLHRVPEARLFSLHDDRDRHFIALDIACLEATVDGRPRLEGGKPIAFKSGEAMLCRLSLPRLYLGRAHILAMTAHLRGRELELDRERVRRLFAATAPSRPPNAAPALTSPRLGVDGGVPPPGEEEEEEED